MIDLSLLPRGAQEYIRFKTPPGSRNAQLFGAACQMRDAGFGIDATIATLRPCGFRDGLRGDEITGTIRSAYRLPPREPASGRAAGPRLPHVASPPRSFAPIPKAAEASWFEGTRFLESDAPTIDAIAQWRGWEPSWVRTLARDGLMGCPEIGGRRLVAFPVRTAEGRLVRLHVRSIPPRRGGWFYWPSGDVPSLPMVLGDFSGARVLSVCEGEWDALTLALAAGWMDGDTTWPDGFAIVGVRGAGGWRAFLDHYGPRWPHPPPGCALFPDRDRGGQAWLRTDPGGFWHALRARCRVLVARGVHGAKDLNDLHRARPITREEIAGMLWQSGLVKEGVFEVTS